MRLLHTSDWHLGAQEGEHSLQDDQRFFIDRICEIVREEQVDAVLLAGDVYDRANAAADAVSLYDYAMTRLCRELKVQVFTIAGNHDSAERLANCRQMLAEAGLHVAGALTREPVCIPMEDAEIWMLPWFTEEKVKSLWPERKQEIHSPEDACRLVCDEIRQRFVPGRKHIVLAHAFITNSETSTSDRAAEIGFATQVGASVFDGFDYVALGHIHKPQDVNDRVRYSGTPMAYSFGKEENQEKSVTIIDTETMERKILPLPVYRRWTTLEGSLADLLEGNVPAEVKDGYVRIRVTDQFIGTENTALLKAIYPHALDIMGRDYEETGSSRRMSAEELRELETDPLEIIRHFFRDTGLGEPDVHQENLFRETLAACSEEEER